MDLESLRLRWIAEEANYEAFGKYVSNVLSQKLFESGMFCLVSYRCKTVGSLLKKQLKNNFTDPWGEIQDKVGVRVIAPYKSQLGDIDKIIRQCFDVPWWQNKEDVLEPNELGYLAVHYSVSAREGEDTFGGIVCEIQLHTQAGHLWSETTHDLAYKSVQKLSNSLNRRIYRLLALVEYFDKELVECREEIMGLENHQEFSMLNDLEKHYYRVASREYNKDLSLSLISELKQLYTAEEIAGFPAILQKFATDNGSKLERIYRSYKTDTKHFMLFQPEALLIFERANKDPFAVRDLWEQNHPESIIVDLVQNIWGASL